MNDPDLSGSRRQRALVMHVCCRRAGQIIRRLPFTLISLAVLGLAAVVTNSHVGDLSREWFNHLAFAPRDLSSIQWPRLITSALVTRGGGAFWQMMGMVALTTGGAEWLAGTRRSVLTFWGVHLTTVLVESLVIALPLHTLGFSLGTTLYLARDVGPSAGSLGCLGLACARLPRSLQWTGGGLVLAGLATVFVLAVVTTQDASVVSADLAHLLAFALGWLSSRIGRRRGALTEVR
jgi:hypothetical protein